MIERMRYPERSSSETDGQRRARVALSKSVEREHAHRERFEPRGRAFPEPIPVGHVWASASELTLDRVAFRAADFGQLCQALGLRPSKPHEDARGRDVRKRRRRRAHATA